MTLQYTPMNRGCQVLFLYFQSLTFRRCVVFYGAMRNAIPKVRQWLVTTDVGAKWIVLAPTRLLAKLNFRHYVGWSPIRSVSTVRRQRSQPDGVRMAWRDA